MEERAKTSKNLTQPQEVTATIHYAHNGPSLESCLVSILSAHLSKNAVI